MKERWTNLSSCARLFVTKRQLDGIAYYEQVSRLLLAVAAFIFDGDVIADVGVITHPHHRGKGLGKSIVLELVRYGIEQRRIVQYTTQEQYVSSKRLAESIGFWLYAVEEGLYLERLNLRRIKHPSQHQVHEA